MNRLICLVLFVLLVLMMLTSRVVAVGPEAVWYYVGFLPFCAETPAECAPYPKRQRAQVELSTGIYNKILDVNHQVNKQIEYALDDVHYGVPEKFSYPVDNKGDCEDYALEKRRRLIEAGVPRRAMRLAVVAVTSPKMRADVEKAWGRVQLHVVLLVYGKSHTLVLDNNRHAVLSKEVAAADYRFLYIQSKVDPSQFDKVDAGS